MFCLHAFALNLRWASEVEQSACSVPGTITLRYPARQGCYLNATSRFLLIHRDSTDTSETSIAEHCEDSPSRGPSRIMAKEVYSSNISKPLPLHFLPWMTRNYFDFEIKQSFPIHPVKHEEDKLKQRNWTQNNHTSRSVIPGCQRINYHLDF